MTIEEQKQRARDEKAHLIMLIALYYGNKYKLEELKKMNLKKLIEIAEKLDLR